MDTNEGVPVEPAFLDRTFNSPEAALKFSQHQVAVDTPPQPKGALPACLESRSDVAFDCGERVRFRCPLPKKEDPVEPRFTGRLQLLRDVRSLINERRAVAEKRAEFVGLEAESPLCTHLAEPEESEVHRERSATGPLCAVFRNTGSKGAREGKPVEGKPTAHGLAHHEATCDERVEVVSGVLAEKLHQRGAKRHAVASDVSEDPLAPLASAVA